MGIGYCDVIIYATPICELLAPQKAALSLWLRPQVDPFGAAGEHSLPARDARNQVQVSVEVGIAAHRGIDKADIVTFRRDGFGDAPAELGYRLPNHALLLDVQVVESGDVTARGDNQVAGAQGAGMWYGHHKLSRHPGVLGCHGTV
jgi:hypothetical protein